MAFCVPALSVGGKLPDEKADSAHRTGQVCGPGGQGRQPAQQNNKKAKQHRPPENGCIKEFSFLQSSRQRGPPAIKAKALFFAGKAENRAKNRTLRTCAQPERLRA